MSAPHLEWYFANTHVHPGYRFLLPQNHLNVWGKLTHINTRYQFSLAQSRRDCSPLHLHLQLNSLKRPFSLRVLWLCYKAMFPGCSYLSALVWISLLLQSSRTQTSFERGRNRTQTWLPQVNSGAAEAIQFQLVLFLFFSLSSLSLYVLYERREMGGKKCYAVLY